MTQNDLPAAVADLMPEVLERLADLVKIPSVAFPGFDAAPVHEMGAAVVDLFAAAGAAVELVEVPGGYPCVFGDLGGPEGTPTVLLYAHYDVQPAPKSQGWSTEPFVATTGADGRIYTSRASSSTTPP